MVVPVSKSESGRSIPVILAKTASVGLSLLRGWSSWQLGVSRRWVGQTAWSRDGSYTRQAIVIVNTIYMRLYEYRGSAGAIALATFGFSRSRSRGVGWIEPGFSRVPHKMNLAEPGDKVP